MDPRFIVEALALLVVSLATGEFILSHCRCARFCTVKLRVKAQVTTSVRAAEVRHLELSGSHLIDTGDDHYAITTPTFSQVNWKT